MSALLDKAVDRARRLPVDQQDAIAALMLDEIANEALWDDAFAQSQDLLERLAAQADQEDRNGTTLALDLGDT